jgi:malonyl-CoA O-methyltransferase
MRMTERSIDKQWVRASFDRAASGYEASAILQKEVGRRMLERLDYINLQPETVLDIGCGTGLGLQALLKRYRKAQVLGMDFAMGMLEMSRTKGGFWHRPLLACADFEALPVRSDSIDLLFSNLTLQWCNRLDDVFNGVFRIMRPDGLFLFTTLGPDTLMELRQSWAQVDGFPHVNQFADMHEVGDTLVEAGFSDVVMDVERIVLSYQSPHAVIGELRSIGAVNRDRHRTRGLMGRRHWQSMLEAYEQFRMSDGSYPATYEVVFGHALRPRTSRSGKNGEIRIPVSGLKR